MQDFRRLLLFGLVQHIVIWSKSAFESILIKEGTMPTDEGAKTKAGLNGSDYHRSRTVEGVTKRNVQTIIKLERRLPTIHDASGDRAVVGRCVFRFSFQR